MRDQVRRNLIDRAATDGFVTASGPVLCLFFTNPTASKADQGSRSVLSRSNALRSIRDTCIWLTPTRSAMSLCDNPP